MFPGGVTDDPKALPGCVFVDDSFPLEEGFPCRNCPGDRRCGDFSLTGMLLGL